MTTHGTFDIDSVPAPSEHDPLTRPPSPHFHPFVGVTDQGRLVTIVSRTRARTLYRDDRGYLYEPESITRDLAGYAKRRAADAREQQIRDEDARDQADTFADALV